MNYKFQKLEGIIITMMNNTRLNLRFLKSCYLSNTDFKRFAFIKINNLEMYYITLDSKWTVTECLRRRKSLNASFVYIWLFLK